MCPHGFHSFSVKIKGQITPNNHLKSWEQYHRKGPKNDPSGGTVSKFWVVLFLALDLLVVAVKVFLRWYCF